MPPYFSAALSSTREASNASKRPFIFLTTCSNLSESIEVAICKKAAMGLDLPILASPVRTYPVV